MIPRLLAVACLPCAALLLASCGDAEPPKPDPRTPAELGRAFQDAFKKDMSEASRAGADWAARAKEMSTRAITSADVERFLAVMPKLRDAEGDPKSLQAALADQGLSMVEWSMLAMRITTLASSVNKPPERLDERTQADLEVLRPYLDRLNAAMKGR